MKNGILPCDMQAAGKWEEQVDTCVTHCKTGRSVQHPIWAPSRPPPHLDELAQLCQPHLLGLGDVPDQHQDGVHNGLAREGQSVRCQLVGRGGRGAGEARCSPGTASAAGAGSAQPCRQARLHTDYPHTTMHKLSAPHLLILEAAVLAQHVGQEVHEPTVLLQRWQCEG